MKPYAQVGNVTLYCATVEEWAREYQGAPAHALLSDPPYELRFMQSAWDASGVSFRPETWAAFLPHLHPGAFCFAFAGTRGWHRQAVAIEDAGFVFHPTVFLLGYVFGSGFPKATRIDTQIDAAAGAEREVVPNPLASKLTVALGHDASISVTGGDKKHNTHLSFPATPLARAWSGHRYGMQALKPAVEPILCFQVPYAGRPVDSITRTGAGALNIRQSRIGTDPITIRGDGNVWTAAGRAGLPHESEERIGRWPSNVCLVHSPSCTPDACAEGCAVRILGEQSGESVSDGGTGPTTQSIGGRGAYQGGDNRGFFHYKDAGTAARFYHQSDWALEVQEQIAGAVPFFYCAKASRAERDAGLEEFEATLSTSHNIQGRDTDNPRNYIGAYVREDGTTFKPAPRRNVHPCCKPLDLCRHLATLLGPPAAYAPRRLLVPFSGVSSEVCGAILSGQWEEIVAVEMSEEYCEIAAARIAYWQRVAAEERAREAERAAQQSLPLEPAPARREKPQQEELAFEELAGE